MDARDLLHPVDRFLEQHWRLRDAVLPGRGWAGLPDLADVDRLLALSRWEPGEIRLERPDAPEMPCLHERGRALPDGTPDLGRIHLAWARGGYTLRLRGVDRRWPSVHRLCRSLEDLLQTSAEAVLVAAPREAPPQPLLQHEGDLMALHRDGDLHYRRQDPPALTPGLHLALLLEDPSPAPAVPARAPRERHRREGVPTPLTLRDLDTLLTLTRARVEGPPWACEHPFHPDRWLQGEPDLAQLTRALDQGFPLALDGLHERLPAVRELVPGTTARLRLTPPGSPPETVPGEVTLLGLHGRHGDLGPGDMLFLPAGDEWSAPPPEGLALRLEFRPA